MFIGTDTQALRFEQEITEITKSWLLADLSAGERQPHLDGA